MSTCQDTLHLFILYLLNFPPVFEFLSPLSAISFVAFDFPGVIICYFKSLLQIYRLCYWKQQQLWNRMTASVLKQDPNTKRFKQTLIYFNTDTQHAHFRGNPLYQATKRHLHNRQTVKNDEKLNKDLSCFGWVFTVCSVLGRLFVFISKYCLCL